ncbi:MAG: type IV secretory system conjugative DNA transfer family protein [candidate division SR1 bacterium]|nr:type IV secretory system conjugative DNA transfer family protein [candidate division SR1 bacterium]
MNENLLYILISLFSAITVRILGIALWRICFLKIQKQHRLEQANKIRFLQVQIPKNAVARSSDIDAKDHIQSMKQNIELMNQVYKNFYAIFDEGWKNKEFGNNAISMEILVEKEVIKFILGVPSDHLMTVEKMIASFYTGAIVENIRQPKILEAGKYFAGGEFTLTKDSVHPLKTYESFEADPMDSILSAFSNISRDEKVGIQILVEPLHENWLKKMRKTADDIKEGKKKLGFWGIIQKLRDSGKKETSEKEQKEKKHSFSQQQLSDFDKKMDDELFRVKIRTIATSPDKQRPRKIIDDISRLFNQYNYIGLNTLKFNKAQDLQTFARHYSLRILYPDTSLLTNVLKFNPSTVLNIKELSSIIHFPHGRFNQNPRIARQKFKVIPAPDDLPSEGIVVGYNNYGGVKREIRITDKDRFRHIYILGQTGTGKSTIMLTQAIDDMDNGRGFTFIDPHGEAVEFLLRHFPKERIDDLIYFDLGNTAYPIGLNPLEVSPDDSDEKDVVTNDLVEMFIQMYGHEIFGPRIQDYFRNACLLLMDQPEGGTIVDIMRLFTDEAFAEAKIRNLKDPVVAAWWNKTYKKMGDREKAEIIPFIQAKFGPFTTGVYVRNIIGQSKSAFKMYDAMQQKKIILMNLAKGISGEETSKLIGKIIAMQVKLSALKRAKIEEKDRVPHYLYVDEFQNYVSQSFESIMSEARKYRLGLVVAHQYTDQLKQGGLGGELDLSKTIFGNIGNMFVYKVGAPDAEFLAKEFEPEFSQTDLTSTEAFMGACKISINNQQTRPFSFKAKIPYVLEAKNPPEKVQIIKQISSLKRGTKRELVDKEIYFRIGV